MVALTRKNTGQISRNAFNAAKARLAVTRAKNGPVQLMLLTKYVEAGWLGRKTKRGFYDYRGDVPVPTR